MIEQLTSAMVGVGAKWVLWLMLGLSVISLAIMLERAWLFWTLRDDIEALMRELGRLLRTGDLEGARRRLEASAGASALQKLKLEKRLAYLGTLGNNAPFIGLLGTVIGIVGAFEELGKANAPLPGGVAAAANAAANAASASQ